MKSIAIIIPACIQVPQMFDAFRDNIRTFKHDAVAQIIVLCNRLTLMNADTLQSHLAAASQCPLTVVHDKERSVAGALNRGIELASNAGVTDFLVTAVDVSFTHGTIDALLQFGRQCPDVALWSSIANEEHRHEQCNESINGLDMSCFMLRQDTIHSHGWFDKEFKPAYFEDNDYVTRVVLAGGSPKKVVRARHRHQGSLTIKVDPEMAHHVRHWFAINQSRFTAKWKTLTDDYHLMNQVCHPTPYNSGKSLTWWPEQDKPGYNPSGGIHE